MDTKPKKTNPLWVKCKKCQAFNAVEVWNVAKYLDRYFNPKEQNVRVPQGTKAGNEVAHNELGEGVSESDFEL